MREHVANQNALPEINPAEQASSERDHHVRPDGKMLLDPRVLQASTFHGPGIGLGRVQVELMSLDGTMSCRAETGDDVFSGGVVSGAVDTEIFRHEERTRIWVRDAGELGRALDDLVM